MVAGRRTIATLTVVWVCSSTFRGQTATTTANDSLSGAISGVVVDEAGDPVAGAAVALSPALRLPTGEPAVEISDSKGRFVFDGLTPDDHFAVTASKAGYFSGQFGMKGRGAGETLAPPIVVTAGQWVRDLRVVLARAGSISGRVSDPLAGPIVGARVRVLQRITVAGRSVLASGRTALSDDLGCYRLSDLSPGQYYVEIPVVQSSFATATTRSALIGRRDQGQQSAVTLPQFPSPVADFDGLTQLVAGVYPTPPRAEDGRWMIYPTTFYPSVSALDSAQVITINAGDQKRDVDILLAPVSGAAISGQVLGDISPAGLSLRLVIPGLEDLGDGSEAATTLVDPQGHFRFVNIPAGSYDIDVRPNVMEYQTPTMVGAAYPGAPRPPGYQAPDPSAGGTRVYAGAGDIWATFRGGSRSATWAHQPISVGHTDIENVLVRVGHSVTLSGRYFFEGNHPKMPGAGGEVMAQPAHGEPALGMLRAESEGDQFVIRGLVPGQYVLAESPILLAAGLRIKTVFCADHDYTYRPIDASAGQDLTECVLTFTDKSISLTGHVSHMAQDTLVQATVIVFPGAAEEWSAPGLSPARFKAVQTGTDGRYGFQTLPAGDYCIIAIAGTVPDAWMNPDVLASLMPMATRIHVDWGQAVVQDLRLQTIR